MNAFSESRSAAFPLSRLPSEAQVAWLGAADGISVCITGKGSGESPEGILELTVTAPVPEVSWLRQIHSTTLVEARPGLAGEGDALFTDQRGLALAIQTADCVPVVLWRHDRLALVHAGWRGLRAGILGRTVEACGLGGARALIGPAIGSCCYEVGDAVAAEVAATVDDQSVVDRSQERPHLDLAGTALRQLVRAGIDSVATVGSCTRCSPDLWSYRRDGAGAGRNFTFAWLADE